MILQASNNIRLVNIVINVIRVDRNSNLQPARFTRYRVLFIRQRFNKSSVSVPAVSDERLKKTYISEAGDEAPNFLFQSQRTSREGIARVRETEIFREIRPKMNYLAMYFFLVVFFFFFSPHCGELLPRRR